MLFYDNEIKGQDIEKMKGSKRTKWNPKHFIKVLISNSVVQHFYFLRFVFLYSLNVERDTSENNFFFLSGEGEGGGVGNYNWKEKIISKVF